MKLQNAIRIGIMSRCCGEVILRAVARVYGQSHGYHMMRAFVKYGHRTLDARYHHNDRAFFTEGSHCWLKNVVSIYHLVRS